MSAATPNTHARPLATLLAHPYPESNCISSTPPYSARTRKETTVAISRTPHTPERVTTFVERDDTRRFSGTPGTLVLRGDAAAPGGTSWRCDWGEDMRAPRTQLREPTEDSLAPGPGSLKNEISFVTTSNQFSLELQLDQGGVFRVLWARKDLPWIEARYQR